MSINIWTNAERARSGESTVMESPERRISKAGAGEPERPFTRPVAGAARCALPALHHHGTTWQHPSPSDGPASCRSASPSVPSIRFVPQVRVSPCTEPCLLWSERIWERFTDTLTLRSAAWRCVRSTRPGEPATSFAFLQPLPSMRSQPIRATKESSGGGTNAFKVVRRVNESERVCL